MFFDTFEKQESFHKDGPYQRYVAPLGESHGQLVPLGFDITAFTPAAYLRRSLQRPLREI